MKSGFRLSSDRIFDFSVYIFLILCLLIIFLPLLNIISMSMSDPGLVMAGKVFFYPVKPTFMAYGKILSSRVIMSGFYNSFIVTFFGTLISVMLTIMAAYPLARKSLKGRNAIMWFFTFTMLFNGGLIPTYLVVMKLNMIDKLIALILPNAIGAWNVIITRTFFMHTIPDEMYEAANMDGSSDIRTFTSIVLPLSKPILAVMALYYAVGLWNSYFTALIYLQSQFKFPLQLVLRNIMVSSQMQAQMLAEQGSDQSQRLAQTEVLKYAIIVFSSLPLLILYPFIQKYFVKGIMIGAIKG